LTRKNAMRLILTAVLLGILLFFLAPRHEYAAKILYILVLVGYGVYQYILKNWRSLIICAAGVTILLLALPGLRVLSEIGVLLALTGWSVLAYVAKREGGE